MFSSRNLALFAVFCSAVIYGISFTVGGEVARALPYTVIVFVRVLVTGFLFWICALFIGKQPAIAKKYWASMVVCAMCGACLNQLFAYKALETAQPIAAAAINISTPIVVLLFSSVLMKNKIPPLRVLGVFIGLIGALILIFQKTWEENISFSGETKGNLYMFFCAVVYAFYLVLAKQLFEKYHPLHVVKWLYAISLPVVFVLALHDFSKVDWQLIPQLTYLKLFYVVFFVTFLNYLFNMIGLVKLKATTVSVFVYLQPAIASLYAIFVGSDTLSFMKVFTILLISAGVYLAGKQTQTPPKK